jgi:hypothetical protein
MNIAELSTEEKTLLASLEPIIRKSVWSNSAKVFEGPCESEGKWIEYPLRLPGQKNFLGQYYHVTLKPDSSTEDFQECYCAFGANHLHTAVSVYRILRKLKQRGLLQVQGFERFDI